MTKISNNLRVIGTGSTSQALGVTAGSLNISDGLSIGTWTLPSNSQVYILSASTSTMPFRIRDYSNTYDAFKVNNNGTVEIKNSQTSTSDVTLTIGSTSSANGAGVIQLGSTSSGTKFSADTFYTSLLSGNGKWAFNILGTSTFYYNSIYIDISGTIPVIGSNTNQTRDLRLASGGGKLYFSIGPSSSTGDIMNISSAGNVAIGTMSNGTAKLHVYTSGTSSSTISFKVQNRDADGYFQVTDDGSAILNGTTYSHRTSLLLQGQGNGGQLHISGNDGSATAVSTSLNSIEGGSGGIILRPRTGGNIYLTTASLIYMSNNSNLSTSNGRIAYSLTEDQLNYSKIALGTQSSLNSNYSTHIGTFHIMGTYSPGTTNHLTSIGLYVNSFVLASTYSGYTQSIIGMRVQPNLRKQFSYNSAITFDVYSGNTQSLAIFDDGNVTIGSTVSSSTKLFVYGASSGAFRIVDGTEGSGRVLTSDANGIATWATASSTGISGTAGYIPVFNTSNSISNSNIYQGASGSILIGYTSSSATYSVNDINTLRVKGNVYFDNNTLTSNKFFLNGSYLFDDINSNISLGYGSLNGNNTVNGSYNIAIGYKSLYSSATLGSYNIGIGYQTLRDNYDGTNNIAIGYNSMYLANDGEGANPDSNIGIGNNTLVYSYGSDNIAIGNSASIVIKNANNNISIGSLSQHALEYGSDNVSIGYNSLYSGVSHSNISIGSRSLYSLIDGHSNISIGIDSAKHLGGLLSSTDVHNVLIGSNVANGLTQGSYNTIIGGYPQSAIGFTQGSYNTLIGYGNTYSSTSNMNNTIIGSRITVGSGITNSIIIADGLGNQRLYIDTSGNSYFYGTQGSGSISTVILNKANGSSDSSRISLNTGTSSSSGTQRGMIEGVGDGTVKIYAGSGITQSVSITSNTFTFTDSVNIAFSPTTGTKIGTLTTQKFGFWNTTPITQPTTAVGSSTHAPLGGTTIQTSDTFDGYTLQQVVKALRNIGLLA